MSKYLIPTFHLLNVVHVGYTSVQGIISLNISYSAITRICPHQNQRRRPFSW